MSEHFQFNSGYCVLSNVQPCVRLTSFCLFVQTNKKQFIIQKILKLQNGCEVVTQKGGDEEMRLRHLLAA